MRERKIGLQEIAKVSGMAISTISAALNGTGRVSDKSRDSIRKIANELNYEPNLAGKLLKQKKCYDIGLVINANRDNFAGSGLFQPLISSYIQQCKADGMRCQIEFYDGNSQIPDLIRNSFVGGVLHCGIITDKIHEWLAKKPEFPFIAIEEQHDCCVKSSFDSATYQATQYLIALGHSRINLLIGPTYFDIQNQIKNGFEKAIQDFDLISKNSDNVTELKLENDCLAMQEGVNWTEKMLEKKDIPSAVICGDLRVTRAVIYALTKAGFYVPEQVSVIGCGSPVESEQTYPAVTAIECNFDEVMMKGFYELNRLIRLPHVERKRIIVEAKFLIRDSVSKLNKRN